MSKRLWIDIETYSSVDLRKTGVYRYAASDDFLILMAAWTTNPDGPIQVATTREEIEAIPGLLDPEVTKVAHNAQFERVCFSHFFGVDGYLPPEQWHDTQAVAAEWGYPQKLEKLAAALGTTPKDPAGTHLINWFAKPDRNGNRRLPEDHPEKWLEFMMYCEQDVGTLVECDLILGDFPTKTEREVYLADQRVNDTGMLIDTRMARQALRASLVNQDTHIGRLVEITGLENPNSVQQLSGWIRKQGVKMPNLRAETVEEYLGTDLPPKVREALEHRQEIALAASKKFGAALNAVLPDKRVRGTLQFFGAHTGRWAGRGTQVQNLPRASFATDAEVEAAVLDLEMGLGGDPLTLKKLVRPMFLGPLTVVDYSAIEARVVAWLAGEEWALEAFRNGRDIYVETAERMGGLSRSQGKIAVLALGYNGGAGSLKAMVGAEDSIVIGGGKYAGKHRNLHRMLDLDPKQEHNIPIATMDDDALYELFVYPWREANSNIVKLWSTLDRRFRTGGPAGKHLTVEKHGKDRLLRLPSGRAICYRKCGVSRDAKGRERLRFDSPAGYRADTYGGRLTENATQAVARDIMAEAIVRLQKKGYTVVGHVHDEILVEGHHDVDLISKIMTEPPAWAEGLPIDGEGFTCDRYKKG